MNTLTIPSEDAQRLYLEEDESNVFNGLRFVAKIFSGEWRWGSTYQLVIEDLVSETFYETYVNEQSGDNWYLSLEDEDEITFDEVVRIEVKTYEYRKPEYVNS